MPTRIERKTGTTNESKTFHAEQTNHGVAILVKEGIKAERHELKTKLNAVTKSRTRNGLTDDYEEEKQGERNKKKFKRFFIFK
jgi:hypothetical protein